MFQRTDWELDSLVNGYCGMQRGANNNNELSSLWPRVGGLRLRDIVSELGLFWDPTSTPDGDDQGL